MNVILAGSLTSFFSFITGNLRNNWIKTLELELQESSAPEHAKSSASLPFSLLPFQRPSASVTQQYARFSSFSSRLLSVKYQDIKQPSLS